MLLQRSKRLTCLLMNGTSLKSEFVLQAEWDKCALLELDITATDLSAECLIDLLTRIPSLRFLSAGQNNGFNDSVLRAWADSGTPRSLVALDLDSSDNISDEGLLRFITRYGPQLQSCVLSGMTHITDQLWMTIFPIMQHIK